MANLNDVISLQNEQSLIETCQRMLCAPSAEAVSHIEKRRADRAFAELVSRYDRWIWKQVNSIFGLDSDDVYSAALEGFQKAITTFDTSSGNALVSWAYHCVRGVLTTLLRKEKAQSDRVNKVTATTLLVHHEDEVHDPYEQEQLHQSIQKLRQATSQLGETAQQIVSMRNEGMRFAEIGAELGKSADATRMAYNRAIAALNKMLTQQPEAEITIPDEPTVFQVDESIQVTKTSLKWCLNSNVRLERQVPISNTNVQRKTRMRTEDLKRPTRTLMHKSRHTRLIKLLDSPALKYISWSTVSLLVLYRFLMGEWLLLLVCSVGGLLLALLKQHKKTISKRHRSQLLFVLFAVLSWSFLTLHTPAYALFFDTLETGLTTLFNRFGVTGVASIPSWIGGVFRLLGIIFLAILAVRFGRSREEDDEGIRASAGKVVQLLAGLLIFDALIELFTT